MKDNGPDQTGQGGGDPFADLSKLRLSQAFTETAGVKKLLTKVPVWKVPPNQYFVRVHPDPKYRGDFALLELKEDNEYYLVVPATAHEIPGEFFMATVRTAITKQGNVFLWPVRLPGPDGKIMDWHRSAAEAAEMATQKWIRVKANRDISSYDLFEAETAIAEPVWPELSFQELLRIAFRDRLIDNIDHPVLKKLRGAA